MSLMSRNKGKRGEREIVHLLQPVVNEVTSSLNLPSVLIQRNTIQSDRGGYDLVGLEWFAPEVKRCETLALKKWWLQCKAQAKPHQTPVLFYRTNGAKWRVRLTTELPFGGRVLVDIAMVSFLRYFRARLIHELGGQNVVTLKS